LQILFSGTGGRGEADSALEIGAFLYIAAGLVAPLQDEWSCVLFSFNKQSLSWMGKSLACVGVLKLK
jgi:hypothetical protein